MSEISANGNDYNTNDYDADTNSGGLSNGGHRLNLLPMLGDVMQEVDAVRGAGATSATSLAIATGSKSFTLDAAVTFRVGTYLRMESRADPTGKYMEGTVTASSGTSLTVNVTATQSSSTVSDWRIHAYVSAQLARAERTVTGAGTETVAATDMGAAILCNAASAKTLNLPALADVGVGFWFHAIGIGAGDWTADGNSAETINGQTTVSFGKYGGGLFITTATEWLFFPSSVGRQTVWIPAGAMKQATTSGPAAADAEASSNKQNYIRLDFDKDADEFAHFSAAMPKSWNLGTVKAAFLWTAPSGSGNVVWGLQAVAVSDDDPIDAAWGTAQTVTDALTATGDLMRTAETGAITIAGTPAAGDLGFFRVYRDADNGSDSFNADAGLVGVCLFFDTFTAADN